MVYTKEYKEPVKLDYACYICTAILSNPALAINHVERVHGYRLPRRHVGHRRPADPLYHFTNDKDEAEVSHYACASCWFHCPETGIAELSDHVQTEHSPQNVDPSKNKHRLDSPKIDKQDSRPHHTNESQKRDAASLQRELLDKLNEVTDLLKDLVVMKQT